MKNKIEDDTVYFPYRIGHELYETLLKHIFTLSLFEDKRLDIKDWICDAIKKKCIKEEETKKHSRSVSKPKVVYLSLEKELNSSIDTRVTQLRNSIGGFSKRQWIAEAIQEQLKEEAEKAKKTLMKFAEQN